MNRDAEVTVRQLVEAMRESVVLTDVDGCIRMVNGAFCRVTGYAAEEVLGRNPRFLQSGWQAPTFYREMWETLGRTGRWEGEIWNRRKDGEIYPEWLSIGAIRNAEGRVVFYLGVFTDITGRKMSEERLAHMAHYDLLTGLPNRLLFRDRLVQGMAQAQRQASKMAVMFLDLDGFKAWNDAHGHAFGDHVLFRAAQRLSESLRKTDTLARVGGDEFMLLLGGVTEESAAGMAQAVLFSLARPLVVDGRDVRIGASIGIALYPDDNLDADNLIRMADAAMYKAKSSGGNAYVFARAARP
jgi:diguanylate cyclase (GGDEF)-like protein/PAS domain S-box-containing protein